jgi:hypothetical protein
MGQRVRVLAVAFAGALALVAGAGGTVSAAEVNSSSHGVVTGGTGTVFMTKSYIQHMADHNIAMAPLGAQSTSIEDTFTTTIYAVTGGDANLRRGTGTVQYSGGTLVTNTVTGKHMDLLGLKYDVANGQLDYLVMTNGGIPVTGMDLAGAQCRSIRGHTQTYSASELLISAASANAMNSVLDTDAVHAGDPLGSFTTTYTVG